MAEFWLKISSGISQMVVMTCVIMESLSMSTNGAFICLDKFEDVDRNDEVVDF